MLLITMWLLVSGSISKTMTMTMTMTMSMTMTYQLLYPVREYISYVNDIEY